MAIKKSTTPNRGFRVADQIQRDLSELIARELAELQNLLGGQEPYGAALVRMAREKTELLEQLAPAQRYAQGLVTAM